MSDVAFSGGNIELSVYYLDRVLCKKKRKTDTRNDKFMRRYEYFTMLT